MKLTSFFTFLFLIFTFSSFSQREDIRFDQDDDRIFYTGYDNLLTVKKGAVVSGENISFSKKNDTLYVVKISRIPTSQKITITVTINGKSESKTFVCKSLPVPKLLMDSYSINGGDHKQSVIWRLAASGLKFGYTKEDQIYSDFFISVSCDVTMTSGGKIIHSESTKTGELSAELQQLLKNTKNYKLEFTNIIYTSTEAKAKVSDIEITVK